MTDSVRRRGMYYAERLVSWIDLAVAVLGIGICILLSPAFLWPAEDDTHGGVWSFIAVVVVLPTACFALLAWISMLRSAKWRWWAQLLTLATPVVIALLLDLGVLDSAWQMVIVLGLPALAAGGYALAGRSQ